MIALKKILVCTDFSPPAQVALDYGRNLARTFGAGMRVLHVVEKVTTHYDVDAGYVALPDLQKEIEDAARRKLAALVTDDDRSTLHAEWALVTSTSAARAIVEYARAEAIDLIVVGTRGRGGMTRLFLGSVAERVVRTAPCPVLTVHDRERDLLVPDALEIVATA
jgi:nucleotide-binding universal stress UspA family protein